MVMVPWGSVPFSLATLDLQPLPASGEDLRLRRCMGNEDLGLGQNLPSTAALSGTFSRSKFMLDTCELSRVPASHFPEYQLSPER
jgi:hypothetical protein